MLPLPPPPPTGGHPCRHGCDGHRFSGSGCGQALPEQLGIPDLLLQHSVEAFQCLALVANGTVEDGGIGGWSDRSSGRRCRRPGTVVPVPGGSAQLSDHGSKAVFNRGMQYPEVVRGVAFVFLKGLVRAPEQFDVSDQTQQAVFLLLVFVAGGVDVGLEP